MWRFFEEPTGVRMSLEAVARMLMKTLFVGHLFQPDPNME